MDNFLQMANSPVMYLIAGSVIAVVVAMSVVFMVKAWKEGVRVGLDKAKMRKAIISSATFTAVPSVGILFGVIALAGSLGVPIPWLRLSVVGAIQYEGVAAEMAVQAQGYPGLSADIMNGSLLVSVITVMTVGIIWGGLFTIVGLKKYQKSVLSKVGKKDNRWGVLMFNAMFVGMVCAFVGVAFADLRGYMGKPGSFHSLIAIGVSAALMGLFSWLVEKKKQKWLENFALSFAMLLGMASAVGANMLGVA